VSAEQKIQMEFVISSSSLDRLQKIMSGGNTTGGQKQGGVAGVSKVLEKFSVGNIAKLSALAIGVSAGVGMVRQITRMLVNSSPMLQSMMKLLNTGIMFILRPIGDFIGFLFRPLFVYLMRTVFIPWYRQMAPIMRQWGTEIGTKLVAFIDNPLETLKDLLGEISWVSLLNPVIGLILTSAGWGKISDIATAVEKFAIDLGNLNAAVGEKVEAFFTSVANSLTGWWSVVYTLFTDLSGTIGTGLTDVVTKLSNAWSTLTLFFQGSLGNVGALIGNAWTGFTTWISENLGGVGTTLQSAWDSFKSFFSSIGSIWTLLGDSWNNFMTFINNIGNLLNNLNPGNFFASLGEGLASGAQQMFGGTTNNKVNVEVNGGGSNFADDAINGLRELVFGWMEDNNSMRQ